MIRWYLEEEKILSGFKKNLKKATESDTSMKQDDDSVISVIEDYFKKNNIKSAIKEKGEWGSDDFKSGKSNSMIIVINPDYKKIAKDLNGIIDKDSYRIQIDNYNTLFLKKKVIKKLAKEAFIPLENKNIETGRFGC